MQRLLALSMPVQLLAERTNPLHGAASLGELVQLVRDTREFWIALHDEL